MGKTGDRPISGSGRRCGQRKSFDVGFKYPLDFIHYCRLYYPEKYSDYFPGLVDMAKKGRKRKENVERYANGRIKRTADGQAQLTYRDTLAPTLVRRMLDEELKRCSDPRFGTQLGRLYLRGEILAAEYQAGVKVAEIYHRVAANNGVRRAARSANWEIESFGSERRIGTEVRDSAEETHEDATPYEQRTMAGDKAYKALCGLFPYRERFALERLCIEDQALTSSEIMTARDALQKLVLHFGTSAAPKKEKKPPKTSVPVVRMRPKVTHEVDHFVSALQGLLPDLSRDCLMDAWSKFCALRDREVYRSQREYAVGAI
jgi:hypothetical protein